MVFKSKILTGVIATILASGCSINIERDNMEKDAEIVTLEKDSESSSQEKGSTGLKLNGQSLRLQSIENNYYAYHFQNTVHESYKDVLNHIEPMSDTLDEVFNFSQLVYDGKMLPPVIEESFDYLGVQSEKSLVKTERRWRIVKDASVIASVPLWQDYLFTGIDVRPNEVNRNLRPSNDEEQLASERGRERGIQEGKEYAKALFNINLARLSKDFLGMLTYKKLEVQGIVQPPILAVSNEPFVYTKGNKEVSIGTERYLITKDSSFSSYKDWETIVSTGQAVNAKDNTFNPTGYGE